MSFFCIFSSSFACFEKFLTQCAMSVAKGGNLEPSEKSMRQLDLEFFYFSDYNLA